MKFLDNPTKGEKQNTVVTYHLLTESEVITGKSQIRLYTCTPWTTMWPVMPSHYKKTANWSARTIVST